MAKQELKEKVYVLKNGYAPLSYTLQSRNKKTSALLYFDPVKQYNRALRYASNQKSIFEDEQDGHAVLDPVIFIDGALVVPATNVVLQHLMSIHPGLNNIYEELDHEKDAQEEIKEIEGELKAVALIAGMGIEELEDIGRMVIGEHVINMPSTVLRRDLLIYARRYPSDLMEVANDPERDEKVLVSRIFDDKLLFLKNNGTEIYYNLNNNKTKLIAIPFGTTKEQALYAFFKTDAGVAIRANLKKLVN